MPIGGIKQPEYINIDSTLRLHRYDGVHDFAYEWYQDTETVYLVDGNRIPYTKERLSAMYSYLDAHGELYFIEVFENNAWLPIGDVTFWQEDMPMVIGDKNYRGRGIGKKVVKALIKRARALGYDRIFVDEIYHYNTASEKCYLGAGFTVYKTKEKGNSYVLRLK